MREEAARLTTPSIGLRMEEERCRITMEPESAESPAEAVDALEAVDAG